ncbi:hypothetical protein Tco_0946788, partial [Tanacetum coccineum]
MVAGSSLEIVTADDKDGSPKNLIQ